MKNSILFSAIFVTLAIFSACKKESNPETTTELEAVATLQNDTTNTQTMGISSLIAAGPSISSIGGGTANGFFQNGQWSGNVSACAKNGYNTFLSYYVINTEYSSDGLNYWLINGSNFGNATGSVSTNSSAITMQVLSWSPTQIKVRPIAPYVLDYKNGMIVTVKTSTGLTTPRSVNVIGMLANGRGFGQCTWEAAFQRKLVNRSIPSPSAYSSSGSVNKSYTPQQYDVLHWSGHTGIIMTSPQSTTSGGVVTYTFQLRERNQNCNELTATTSTQTFKRSPTTVTQGIYSANRGLGVAVTYWR
jgi:hypothetical protein